MKKIFTLRVERGFTIFLTLRVEVNFCVNVLSFFFYFFMRGDSYIIIARPYKALKCKIQQNRFTNTIALITVPRRTFMGP